MSLHVLFVCVCVSGVDTILYSSLFGGWVCSGRGRADLGVPGVGGGGEECHIPIYV
jgi:hypothetical protein